MRLRQPFGGLVWWEHRHIANTGEPATPRLMGRWELSPIGRLGIEASWRVEFYDAVVSSQYTSKDAYFSLRVYSIAVMARASEFFEQDAHYDGHMTRAEARLKRKRASLASYVTLCTSADMLSKSRWRILGSVSFPMISSTMQFAEDLAGRIR